MHFITDMWQIEPSGQWKMSLCAGFVSLFAIWVCQDLLMVFHDELVCKAQLGLTMLRTSLFFFINMISIIIRLVTQANKQIYDNLQLFN